MNNIQRLEEMGFLGPPASEGPLPALFYFALSMEDSLLLNPFNQPVAALSELPLRIFSLTLPGHENNLPPTQALTLWAKEVEKGHNFIASFVEKVGRALETLEEMGLLIPEKIAVAGLSRGAFIATHVAAKFPHFRTLLGFAPLTQLGFAKEFEHLRQAPLVHSLNLEHCVDALLDREVRFYIGNVDTRVNTRSCFTFIEKLAQTAHAHRIRSPKVELIITPSIGMHGHGTSQRVFEEGARWVAEKLEVLHGM